MGAWGQYRLDLGPDRGDVLVPPERTAGRGHSALETHLGHAAPNSLRWLMPAHPETSELHPAALADLIDRMENAASLLAWELPVADDLEHRMALDLARMRLLEGASAIATLAEQVNGRSKAAA
jgi:hypothetical protein